MLGIHLLSKANVEIVYKMLTKDQEQYEISTWHLIFSLVTWFPDITPPTSMELHQNTTAGSRRVNIKPFQSGATGVLPFQNIKHPIKQTG